MYEKIRIGIFASILCICLFLLSGCGDRNAAAETGNITIAPEIIQETSADYFPEIDRDVFYSIPDENLSEGYSLCAADMHDDNTAELLYADPLTFDYKILLYSLGTGETEDVYSGVLTAAEDYTVSSSNFIVVNASPLIVDDIWSNTLYVFEENFAAVKAVDITDWNVCDMTYLEKDRCIVYQDSSSAGLCRYSLDTGEISDVFEDTLCYQSLYLEEILDKSNMAVYSGERISDSSRVNVLVDLSTGNAMYETAADIDFYEAGGHVYAFREDGATLAIGLFNRDSMQFDTCCEIEMDNYYVSMCVDEEEELLFICSWKDDTSYSLSCYNLAYQKLMYEDSFDISGYISDKNEKDDIDGIQTDTSDQEIWEGEYNSEDYITLDFSGSCFSLSEANGTLITVDSIVGLEDVVVWNLSEATVMDKDLPSSASWIGVECSGPPVTVDYTDNSEYAEALSDKYGVDILMGEDAAITFDNYEAEPMLEEGTIYRALCILEKSLSLYPDNFFRQFSDESISGISFYLVGSISPVGMNSIDDPGGFAYLNNGIQMIILNTNYTNAMQSNVCHEISHAIDKRLENLWYEGDTQYIDENKWSSFNPKGFDYYYSYLDENGKSYEYSGSDEYTSYSSSYWTDDDIDAVYFVDIYAKTYPTEDRARLMEMILAEGDIPEYMDSIHIQKKIKYYFSAIREAWDTTGWPQVTSWEEALIQ